MKGESMEYTMTNWERETIIIFNEAEPTADIVTFNKSMIRKLSALCESRPNDASESKTEAQGCRSFTVPKKWIKVNAGMNLSEGQVKALRGRANVFKQGKGRAGTV